MKTSIWILLVIIIFILGIFLGFNIKKTPPNIARDNPDSSLIDNVKNTPTPSIKNIVKDNPIPSPKSCKYGGKIYKSGESFPSDDGCNNCSCQNGNIACTLMACE